MAVVRCGHCGAVVTALTNADSVEISYGGGFREKCRGLSDRAGADFVGSAAECPETDLAIREAAFRTGSQRNASRGKKPILISERS